MTRYLLVLLTLVAGTPLVADQPSVPPQVVAINELIEQGVAAVKKVAISLIMDQNISINYGSLSDFVLKYSVVLIGKQA